MNSSTPVLPVERHTVEGLMKLVDSYRNTLYSSGYADVIIERNQAYAAIRAYAERLASPPPQPAPGEVRAKLIAELQETLDWDEAVRSGAGMVVDGGTRLTMRPRRGTVKQWIAAMAGDTPIDDEAATEQMRRELDDPPPMFGHKKELK